MEQAIDAFFDLDERTVVRQVANAAFDHRARRVAVGDLVPRVRLRLLHAERDLLLLLVDIENLHLDLLVDMHQLARMADALGPAHFADVHQTFDAVFELHERAVAHHVDHGALHRRADRVLVRHLVPRAGALLLQAQGDLLLLVVDVENHHLDLVVDLHHFRRVIDAAPAHIGDVEQAVDAAQVDERAEVGDVLHDALAELADFQLLEQFALLLCPLGLDQAAAADDDVAACFVDLEDEALDFFADVFADIVRPADIHLARRQEHVHADIDQAARP